MSVSKNILSRPKRRHPLKYTGSRHLAIVDYCSWTGRRRALIELLGGDVLNQGEREMKAFIWRLRFSAYGYKKTSRYIGCGIHIAYVPFSIWWEWSASSADAFGMLTHPHDAAMEEVYALSA